jgi:hypothetical protein
MSGKLAGKTAVVTGASQGIGAAIASHRAFAVQASVAKPAEIQRLFADSSWIAGESMRRSTLGNHRPPKRVARQHTRVSPSSSCGRPVWPHTVPRRPDPIAR